MGGAGEMDREAEEALFCRLALSRSRAAKRDSDM